MHVNVERKKWTNCSHSPFKKKFFSILFVLRAILLNLTRILLMLSVYGSELHNSLQLLLKPNQKNFHVILIT